MRIENWEFRNEKWEMRNEKWEMRNEKWEIFNGKFLRKIIGHEIDNFSIIVDDSVAWKNFEEIS